MPRADTSAKHSPPPAQMGAAAAPIWSRNASPQGEAAGQQPKQHTPRSRPKLRMHFSWELFMHAQCHLLNLLHRRSGLDLTTLARIASLDGFDRFRGARGFLGRVGLYR